LFNSISPAATFISPGIIEPPKSTAKTRRPPRKPEWDVGRWMQVHMANDAQIARCTDHGNDVIPVFLGGLGVLAVHFSRQSGYAP
jgi:hypothetical protein